MKKSPIFIDVNSNFHHVSGEDLFTPHSDQYAEYRKKWHQWPTSFAPGDYPLFLDIEVTSSCNLKCPFCATTYRGEEIKRGNIKFELVKKIIEEGAGHDLYGVKFNIRGEPLLHKEIDSMVAFAKKKGLIDVYFNTNAMLLNKNMAERLIEAGLDRISVSFEGYTKEVFEKYRVGAVFETVVSNIESLQELKRDLGVDHPKIRVQTVMLDELANDFDAYREFWRPRVDEVGYLDYKEMNKKKRGMKYPWACPQIWQRMAIWWDGTILPCNHDDDGLLELGNANEISISSAWNSDQLNQLREAHSTGMAHTYSACDGCYLRDSEIIKHMEKEGA